MIVPNLAENFGVLADTVEVVIAVILIIGGIFLTYGDPEVGGQGGRDRRRRTTRD